MPQIANPVSPTASLPPLNRLSSYSSNDVMGALANLRGLYFPSQQLIEKLRFKKGSKPHLVHNNSVPDSGYASAEDDDNDGAAEDDVLGLLRSDEFERAFAIKWLIGFTARSDTWSSLVHESEAVACARAIDEAAVLLALFTNLGLEQDITRRFSFQHRDCEPVQVELNDAPLVDEDHTSVGLQSWASSILLAERICADSSRFGLEATLHKEGLRVLELGAGTGLLSITVAQILARAQSRTPPFIVATDFHPDVLANLQRNVDANDDAGDVLVRELDWSKPNLDRAPFNQAFDVILAADVVYEPPHASWIANCVSALLARPAGVLWMIIVLRTGGRHEGLSSTVAEAFSHGTGGTKLAILEEETLRRIDGHGRADEMGYKLFKIGWVQR
ncbi:putative methyltransferase-domain-containing protein [Lactarius akahatsu]|uniref:Methyltransferase-domain-containing protein n=1 Tax=Lactarius akahatsu TaxID=416441 RepID=A0AAD4LN00_9AGAM|nr:putative methyltransferase-domain-containing protein [Lactarius akahatsu]